MLMCYYLINFLTRFILYEIPVSNTVIHIYPSPPLGQDMTQGQFLSGV